MMDCNASPHVVKAWRCFKEVNYMSKQGPAVGSTRRYAAFAYLSDQCESYLGRSVVRLSTVLGYANESVMNRGHRVR